MITAAELKRLLAATIPAYVDGYLREITPENIGKTLYTLQLILMARYKNPKDSSSFWAPVVTPEEKAQAQEVLASRMDTSKEINTVFMVLLETPQSLLDCVTFLRSDHTTLFHHQLLTFIKKDTTFVAEIGDWLCQHFQALKSTHPAVYYNVILQGAVNADPFAEQELKNFLIEKGIQLPDFSEMSLDQFRKFYCDSSQHNSWEAINSLTRSYRAKEQFLQKLAENLMWGKKGLEIQQTIQELMASKNPMNAALETYLLSYLATPDQVLYPKRDTVRLLRNGEPMAIYELQLLHEVSATPTSTLRQL